MGLFDREGQLAEPAVVEVDQPEAIEQPAEQGPEVEETQDQAAPVEQLVRVIYVGKETYNDDVFGTLQGGDERTVTPSEAEELAERKSDGKPLFAIV